MITSQKAALLDSLLSEVADNAKPEDVFGYEELCAWALRNSGSTELRQIIREDADPEDVFSTTELEAWATANGFIKE